MRINLKNNIPKEILLIAKQIEEHGGRLYLVGGGTIDILYGRTPKDWDIEVFHKSIEELESLLSSFGKVDLIGKKFGILKLKLEELDFEFSIPRTENNVGIKHNDFDISLVPDLSINEAARRRDFTINAIYLDLISGEIIDPFGGQKDLKRSMLCHIDPIAFIEDPLRCFRAMRFVSYKVKYVSLETKKLCSTMLDQCKALSTDSVIQEWNKMLLLGNRPDRALRFLRDSNLIELYPEIKALIDCKQSPIHHREGDVFEHCCLVAKAAVDLKEDVPEDWRLAFMWAAILHDIGKPKTSKTTPEGKITSYNHDKAGGLMAGLMMTRMGFPIKLKEQVKILVDCHMIPITYNDKTRLLKWREVQNKIPLNILAYFTLADSSGRISNDPVDTRFNKTMAIWKSIGSPEGKIEPIVNGQDLINLGYSPGPKLGKLLQSIYEKQLQSGIEDKEELIERIK